MPIQFTNLSKKLNGPKEKAIADGQDVYDGLTGVQREFDFVGSLTEPNPFVAKTKDNPDYENFYRNSDTFMSMAATAQAKIDRLSKSYYSDFKFPVHRDRVDYWLNAYHDGARKGLINEFEEVGPWSIGQLATQPGNSGSSKINPNEANQFPSQGVSV